MASRNIYRRSYESKQVAATKGEYAQRCHIKTQCGSCKHINENYEDSLQSKYQRGLEILKGHELIDGVNLLGAHRSPQIYEYRCHIKLAVRAGTGEQKFQIGLFKPGSHEVVDLDQCPVQSEAVNRLIADVRTSLNASSLTPYDEKNHTGDIRYLAIRTAHHTGAMMLTFVARSGEAKREIRNLVTPLRHQHKLASVHLNVHAEPGNAIFGEETHHLTGSPRLREGLCDLVYEISPTAFFQVNPWVAQAAYRRIEQLVGATAGPLPVAWDFFCGIGQISLLLAKNGYRTVGIEMNATAIEDARYNAKINELTERTHFIAGRTEEVQQQIPTWAEKPDLVIVNPSRKGMPAATTQLVGTVVAGAKQARLIYLSCEVETLAHDLAELRKSGLRLRQLEAFDMFPFTDKLEWLAVVTP